MQNCACPRTIACDDVDRRMGREDVVQPDEAHVAVRIDQAAADPVPHQGSERRVDDSRPHHEARDGVVPVGDPEHERLMHAIAERLGFDVVSLRLELFGRRRGLRSGAQAAEIPESGIVDINSQVSDGDKGASS